MNTTDILKTLEEGQKVLDKDSFSIIQNLVSNMEEYDDFYYRAKTQPKFKQVLHELQMVIYASTPVEQENEVLSDPAVKSIVIKESYTRDMINQIRAMNNDYLYDVEWDVSDEEMYESDEEGDFQNTTFTNWDQFF